MIPLPWFVCFLGIYNIKHFGKVLWVSILAAQSIIRLFENGFVMLPGAVRPSFK